VFVLLHRTSLRLHCRLRQVARPSSGSVVVFVRLLDLLTASSLSSPAQKTSRGFYVRNEGLHVGCAPDGPAKCFWVLGRYTLETFVRSACLEWLCQTLCNYAGYLDVSTLCTFKINIFLASSSTDPGHRNFSFDVITHYRRPLHAMHLSRSCWVSSDTGHH
jgi:hypothetical protein